MINEILEQLFQFIDRGGWVLYLILALLVAMWALFVAKFMVLFLDYPVYQEQMLDNWRSRQDRRSWFARQIKIMMLADLFRKLDVNMALIKTMIALCPLFGLLGTVSGMIEVFELMATMGNGSPRAMAAGISKATIPTMAGMVAALTGLMVFNVLNKMIERKKVIVEQQLYNH